MSGATRFIEKTIIRRLVKELKAAGFVPVQVWDSEEYVPASTARKVIEVLLAVDAICTVHFAPASDPQAWGQLGVMLVTGNGCDIISDWHCGNEVFNAAIERVGEYVDRMEAA